MFPKPGISKNCQQPPKARRGKRAFFHRAFEGSVALLIHRFWVVAYTPVREYLIETTTCVLICHTSSRSHVLQDPSASGRLRRSFSPRWCFGLFVWGRTSCISGYPWIFSAAKNNLALLVLQPLSPWCWNSQHVPPCLVWFVWLVLVNKSRALCMLTGHPTYLAPFSPRLFVCSSILLLVLIVLGCNPELWLGAKQAHSHWVPSLALVDDFKIKT